MSRGRRAAVACIAASAVLTFATASAVQAQDYPTRQIRAIVSYSAGSGADITARHTMAKLSEVLKQNILVENRPGTSAMVGTDAVAKAAPDGYTLLFSATQHAINPMLQKKLPYDTLKDFVSIARVTSQPLFLGVSTTLPVNSVAELIKLIKANPGKYNYASTGIGTSIHLAGAYFVSQAGLDMTHVPYTNQSQTMVDLGRGEVQIIFYTYQPLEPLVQTGRLKILASTGAQRSSWAPDVPTMEESGMPGFVMPAWHAVFAPAQTPKPIVATLEAALAKVAQDPAYKKLLEPTGTDVYYASSKELTVFLESEIKRFGAILKTAGVTPH
jgi:tripartite-type tricarboxylate transporter receptor subunit TctC